MENSNITTESKNGQSFMEKKTGTSIYTISALNYLSIEELQEYLDSLEKCKEITKERLEMQEVDLIKIKQAIERKRC